MRIGKHESWKVATSKATAIAIATGIILYLALIAALPWHMDEYIMFHRLACLDSIQPFNNFEHSCFRPDLRFTLPIGLSYERSFSYGGIASSLIQAPFQAIWDNLETPRIVGFFFLIASGFGISRSFRLGKTGTVLTCLWFPIAYSLIHDGGPVRISFLALSWTPFICNKFAEAKKPALQISLAIALSLLWAFSAEDKPYFFYLIPGSFALTYASIAATKGSAVYLIHTRRILIVLAIATVIASALVLLADVNGLPYFSYLADQVKVDKITSFSHTIRLLFDFPEQSERIIENNLATKSLSAISIMLSLLAYAVAIYTLKKKDSSQNLRLTLLLTSVGLFWFFGWIAGGRFHHHFVFAQIPAIVIFSDAIVQSNFGKTPKISGLLAILISLNLFSLSAVYAAPKNHYFSSSAFINVISKGIESSPPNTIINCSSWGCYYSHSLAGNMDRPVVWANDEASMKSLGSTASANNFHILHICYACDLKSIKPFYKQFTLSSSFQENGWSIAQFSPNRH